MATYVLNTTVALESGGGAVDQVLIVAPVNTTQGQALLTSSGVFQYYTTVPNTQYFNANTKVILNRFRFSIPQYRGVTYSKTVSGDADKPINLYVTSETTGTNVSINFSADDYGQWVTLERIIETPDAGERFFFQYPSGVVHADFRNVQTVYADIYPKLLLEIEIISPYAPAV